MIMNCDCFVMWIFMFTPAGEYGATLWKMPEYSMNSSVLEKLADLDGHEKKIKWYVIMSSYQVIYL